MDQGEGMLTGRVIAPNDQCPTPRLHLRSPWLHAGQDCWSCSSPVGVRAQA